MGCVHKDATAHAALWNIPKLLERNCVNVSMAEYVPIHFRKSEIMNGCITERLTHFILEKE